MTSLQPLTRFLVASLVLLSVAFLVPGFAIHGFLHAILTVAVITALGWIWESFFSMVMSPYRKGLTQFVSTAILLYFTQLVVQGISVSILGALLASSLIGMIDLFLPLKLRYWAYEEPVVRAGPGFGRS